MEKDDSKGFQRGKKVMASDEDIQDVLNKVELIKKRMKIVQVEELERKQRNLHSDEILSRFSEPQMRQQWRIYKMVEDQCSRIEDEVRIEVERKMRLKRMQLREADHPSGLIKQVGRIRKDVKFTPKPKMDSSAIDFQSRPSRAYKPPILSKPLRSEEPIKKTFNPPVTSPITKKEPMRPKAPSKSDESVPQGLSISSKNNPKVRKQFLSPSLPSNVKLIHVTHHQPPRQPITLLSGHVYPGVDIPPSQIQHKPTPPILIIRDDSVEIPSISRASTHSRTQNESSRNEPESTTGSSRISVPYEPKKAEQNAESNDNTDGSKEYNLKNSERLEEMEAEENYERQEDDDRDAKEDAEEDEEDTLGTDRLSTIPEDTESKVVSYASVPADIPQCHQNAIEPGPNQPQQSPVPSDCTEGPQSFISGFHSSDITLKEGVLSQSDESDLSPRSKPCFIPESFVPSPEKFPLHFETDPDSCTIPAVVPPLKEMAKFVLYQNQSSLNLRQQPPPDGLNNIATKLFQTEATQTSLPEVSLDSGTLAEATTMEEIEQNFPTKESSSMPSTETELSEGQLLVSFSTLLSDGEVSRAELSNPNSNVYNPKEGISLLEPRSSKSTSEGEIPFPHPTSS